MRHTEILKAIMRKEGVKQGELAQAIGMGGNSGISLRINRKNGSIMNISELVEALDYEMVIRPATKEPLAANEYVLHYRDYEGED